MEIKKALVLSMMLAVAFMANGMLGEESPNLHPQAKMIDEDTIVEVEAAAADCIAGKDFKKALFIKLDDTGYATKFVLSKDFTQQPDAGELWVDFASFVEANNACKCYGLLEDLNKDGKKESMDVFIYGKRVQDVSHCQLFKKEIEKLKKSSFWLLNLPKKNYLPKKNKL